MHLTHFVIVRKFEMSLQLSTFTTLWLPTDMCCTCGNPREEVRRGQASCSSLISSCKIRWRRAPSLLLPSQAERIRNMYIVYISYIDTYRVCTCCLYISAHVPQQATLNPSHAAQSKANKPKSLIN